MRAFNEHKTDVLIIGSGIAGIRAAIEASERGVDVIQINKGAFCKDGAAAWMAGNGFQAALYAPDSASVHIEDTIKGGWYLNNQNLVKAFLSLGPKMVSDMEKWGVRLTKQDSKFYQLPFPGHSFPRSVCGKPGLFLGPEYRKALYRQCKKRGIKVREDFFVGDLLRSSDGVGGAIGLDLRTGAIEVYRAKSVILATGGFMGCYNFTTANPTATGDGHAMAYRAGVKMMDMEFVQFIPAAHLWPPNARGDIYPYLLWINLHPHFYNSLGERFLERYYPDKKEWVTREAAARAIMSEVRAGRGSEHGGAYMSFRHLPENLIDNFLQKAAGVHYFQKLSDAGFDIRRHAIEVAPGAHYVQGGCWINEKCETTCKGLYAVGEVGSGGKDGADRLAGNSITFCLAMGLVAGQEAALAARGRSFPEIDRADVARLADKMLAPVKRKGGERPFAVKKVVRDLLSSHASLGREEAGLKQAVTQLQHVRAARLGVLATASKEPRFNLDWLDALEVGNMVDVAEMICSSALTRTETRGLHERIDYPKQDPSWLKHIMIRKVNDNLTIATEPVDFSVIQPR
jgi:succinate dehydrogenase / fumarate reductase, flavoprotein subunit